jgi:hypothetical protein
LAKLSNLVFAVTSLALSLPFACSSSSDKATVSDLFDRRAELACRKNGECCSGSGTLSARYNTCLENDRSVRRTGSTLEEELNDALTRGTISLDEIQEGECFKQIGALDCAGWAKALSGGAPGACLGVIVGKVSEGEVCTLDYECQSQRCSEATAENPTRVCLSTRPVEQGCVGIECEGICAADPRSAALFGR